MEMYERIEEVFGDIFEEALIEKFAKEGKIIRVEPNEKLISRGDPIIYVPIIMSGTAKVVRADENGEEHILFYLDPGDACAATFSICGKDKFSEVDLIIETPSEVLLIPFDQLDYLTKNYPGWRYYVCRNYNKRIGEFLKTMDTIVFMKMDQRILEYLKNASKAHDSNVLSITHQEIANDLSTSRVVVSRLLKSMENQGLLKLYRNKIELF